MILHSCCVLLKNLIASTPEQVSQSKRQIQMVAIPSPVHAEGRWGEAIHYYVKLNGGGRFWLMEAGVFNNDTSGNLYANLKDYIYYLSS